MNPPTISDSAIKHKQLLKSGDEILQKLAEVRRSKAFEMMKYETITRMNAASVSAYLRQERLKPSNVKPSLSSIDEILQKHQDEMRNHAALIIQQFFRKITHQKQIERILCTWKWVPLEKRLQYIDAVSKRMSGGCVPRKIDLSAIKYKLEERKRAMHDDAEKFVQREELIKRIERDLKLLNGITNIEELMKITPNNFSMRTTGGEVKLNNRTVNQQTRIGK